MLTCKFLAFLNTKILYFCSLINIKRKKVNMRPDFSNIDFKKLPQNPTDFRHGFPSVGER